MTGKLGAEGRSALGNLLLKALSMPIESACGLLVVLLSAPLLGAETFGRYQFAATVTTLLALGTDLGLGMWTTRTLARDRDGATVVIGTGLRVRAVVTLGYAAAIALSAAVARRADTRWALLLLGGSALANAYVQHLAAVFRGFDRFADETRLNILRATGAAAAGLGALALWRSLPALAAGTMAGTAIALAAGTVVLARRYPVPELTAPASYDRALARTAVREGVPIWLAGLLSILYFKGDTVLLRLFRGDAELGAYSAAYKIFEGSMIPPAVILTATFPALSRAHADRAHQRRWELAVGGLLLGLGLLAGAAIYLTRAWLIAKVFGPGYTAAVPSLRLLSLGVPLLYFNYGLTYFLIARDLGHKNMLFAGVMLVVNVALNLGAIPRFGAAGAAGATVLTELSLTACCLATLLARRSD